MEIKEFSSIIDLEFSLFEEIDIKNTDFLDSTIEELVRGLGDYRDFKLIKVIKKHKENKIICVDDDTTYLIEDILNLNVGDFLFIIRIEDPNSSSYLKEKIIIKADKNVVNEKFLTENSKGFLNTKDFRNCKLITQELIKNLNEKAEEKEREEEERQERERAENSKEMKKEKTNKQNLFEKGEEVEIKDYKINENIIIKDDTKYILVKNVNEIFSFSFLDKDTTYDYNTKVLSQIENFLIEKEESFKKEVKSGGSFVEKYNLEFGGGGTKINGERISKAKIIFILSRIDIDTTKEKIKMWNKLTGMKIDFLNKTKIECNNVGVPISVNLIGEDDFEVEFMNKKRRVGWLEIKHTFFYGGKSRSICYSLSKGDLLKFTDKFDLTKLSVLEYMKRATMLKELEI